MHGERGLGQVDPEAVRTGRVLDLVTTCSALVVAWPSRAATEEAELGRILRTQALVLRLQRCLDEAELLGLAAHLTQSALIWRWLGRERGIALGLDLDRSVVVPFGSVTPLARIVHEIVTDCVERAFVGGGTERIGLSLARDGDAGATITIEDDGAGLEPERRFGTRPHRAAIVTRLAADVGADLSSSPRTSCGGTSFTLRFPSPR